MKEKSRIFAELVVKLDKIFTSRIRILHFYKQDMYPLFLVRSIRIHSMIRIHCFYNKDPAPLVLQPGSGFFFLQARTGSFLYTSRIRMLPGTYSKNLTRYFLFFHEEDPDPLFLQEGSGFFVIKREVRNL